MLVFPPFLLNGLLFTELNAFHLYGMRVTPHHCMLSSLICDITGSISFTWECTILLQIIKNSTTVNPSPGNNLLPFSSKAHKMPKVSKFYQTRII